jgi:alpha,alpha-trehalase
MERKERWATLDNRIRTEFWDADLATAREHDIRQDPKGNLLYLPFPYITASGGAESFFPEMYCYDSHFINMGLLAHDRADIVGDHIRNHLFMIDRYGMVLNGNRSYYMTRSQTPQLADTVVRYFEQTNDVRLLRRAYPSLCREFREYWCADHHSTPTGLATNRDLGDPELRPELAAEAEITDFTACFEGDVRRCNPVLTNAALAQYSKLLGVIADELGLKEEAADWRTETDRRVGLIDELLWDDQEGFYFDYRHDHGRRIRCWSLTGFAPLWYGLATPEQAERAVGHLSRFLNRHGLAQTDLAYPSPHPEFAWVQFGYPAGWPSMNLLTVMALDHYGFAGEAETIATRYLSLILDVYQETGALWEKYNVVDGGTSMPKERYQPPEFHGWTCTVVTLFGRRVFEGEPIRWV